MHEISILNGSEFLKSMALYKVAKDGSLSRIIGIDAPAFLNGMSYLGDKRYLIADALNGKICQFDLEEQKLSVWLESDLLQPE